MKNKNMIRVILVDDHAFVRRGIRRILEKSSNICVIAEADTGAAALRLVREMELDVLVLDMDMPDMKGIHVAQELRSHRVPVAIVILSACDDEHFIREILQAGVDAFLSKSEPPAKIRQVITRVSENHAFAVASLLMVLLPKLGWMLVQAAGSVSMESLDLHFLLG